MRIAEIAHLAGLALVILLVLFCIREIRMVKKAVAPGPGPSHEKKPSGVGSVFSKVLGALKKEGVDSSAALTTRQDTPPTPTPTTSIPSPPVSAVQRKQEEPSVDTESVMDRELEDEIAQLDMDPVMSAPAPTIITFSTMAASNTINQARIESVSDEASECASEHPSEHSSASVHSQSSLKFVKKRAKKSPQKEK